MAEGIYAAVEVMVGDVIIVNTGRQIVLASLLGSSCCLPERRSTERKRPSTTEAPAY